MNETFGNHIEAGPFWHGEDPRKCGKSEKEELRKANAVMLAALKACEEYLHNVAENFSDEDSAEVEILATIAEAISKGEEQV